MSGFDPFMLLARVVALLIGITVHEFGHALASHRLGDPTPDSEGRLTLNPLAHLDPFGTVIFPLFLLISGSPFLFGWAKPVHVQPGYWRNYRKGNLLTSLAGPGMNLAAAVVFGMVYRWELGGEMILTFSLVVVLTNLALAIFNLFPVPPLDGSHVLESLLPPHLALEYAKIKPYGMIILVGMMMLGLFGRIMGPLVGLGARVILGL